MGRTAELPQCDLPNRVQPWSVQNIGKAGRYRAIAMYGQPSSCAVSMGCAKRVIEGSTAQQAPERVFCPCCNMLLQRLHER